MFRARNLILFLFLFFCSCKEFQKIILIDDDGNEKEISVKIIERSGEKLKFKTETGEIFYIEGGFEIDNGTN